jgi:hypothetical protein
MPTPTPVTPTNIDHHVTLLKPTPLACDATNGNSAPNGGNLILELNNTGGSPYTVTISANSTGDGQPVTPLTYTLAAAETRLVGGWPPSYYGNPLVFTANNVAVKYIAYTV